MSGAAPTVDLSTPLTAARDVRALLIEREELLVALKAIAELGGKTLFGGEGHEPGFAHQLGANLAFCQAAEIANVAIAKAEGSATPAVRRHGFECDCYDCVETRRGWRA
ncbi:MAG: hypothetical protein JSR67_03805 [Proteobacteria bacterium]|nr:hypothetical protein [Pseudomonadota bacterium]